MMGYIRTHTLNKLLICTILFFNIGCTKNDRLKKNDELVNIVNFFINEYKISNNRNFLISEYKLSYYDNIEIIDSLKYVYIHIQDYQNDIPYVKINDNRELLRARTGSYNIYYEVDKGDAIRIPNYLEWEKVEPEIRDETPMIVDYIELQCLYNLKEKKIEL
ncbi:hypothetical protein [Paenimyroides aestuarii]|uniref:Lipoprotein n=1 Tax=Paenimyroides aestuarii TaxID=2968490 RepID=A0ABY5NTV5_9FLAO|nr:hypothetical protein [Paenimyroides aestuarii]UUV22012.1 hypothetical protein NPX36_02915 [Paenimyroides aestuarii]